MVRRFRANDRAESTLNGSVTASDTSWVLADASSFPSEGDFFCVCEGEIVKVTAVTSNTFTVERAQSGTTNTSHSSGKSVRSIITKEDIEGRLNENDMLRAIPYGKILSANGTVLTASDFTIVNTGTGNQILDGNDGTIIFECRNMAGDDVSGITRNFADGTDFDLYIHSHTPHWDADPWSGASGTNRAWGLWFRQSTGGNMKGCAFYAGKTIQAQSRSTYLATPTVDATHGAEGRSHAWMKLEGRWNVGGNPSTDTFTFYYSWDSIHWRQIYQYSSAYTGLEIGLWVSNLGQAGWRVILDSWLEDKTV